tara:strand:+ start:69 stop:305 length:237 start_codon:yes stop_codon:yes gene_type:complete
MTTLKIKEIINNEFVGNYKTEKINSVAKAVSKFFNKYEDDYWIDGLSTIDGCLQMYSIEDDLLQYLEENKQIFFNSKY